MQDLYRTARRTATQSHSRSGNPKTDGKRKPRSTTFKISVQPINESSYYGAEFKHLSLHRESLLNSQPSNDAQDGPSGQTSGKSSLTKLRIASWNTNGLGKSKSFKKHSIINRMLNYDIVCIQETHAISQDELQYLAKKLNRILIAPPPITEPNSKSGTAVYISSKFAADYDVTQAQRHPNGHYISLPISWQGQRIQIINAYFPQTEIKRLELLAEIDRLIDPTAELIFAADFNFVEAPEIDNSVPRSDKNTQIRRQFESFRISRGLTDSWRFFNPLKIHRNFSLW